MLKKINIFLLFLSLSQLVFGQIPEKPNPPRLVNDYVNLLSTDEVNALERKLVAFDDSTGTEIAIVIVSDLGGMDKAAYTIALGKQWGVGGEKNNGVVIMVKPTGGKGQRHSFIAVGKGLEGVIPDITAKRIESNEMIPAFKQQRFYDGLNNATDIIMGLANKDFAAADYVKESKGKGLPRGILIIIIILFFVVVSFLRRRRSHSIGGSDIPFWAALMMMNSGNRGRYDDFNSGGGDFGGFGGGDFGGGGAGGDW